MEGLLKFHKSSIPLRPILSSINHYSYKIAKFLISHSTLYQLSHSTTTLLTASFYSTNIPVNETIEIISDLDLHLERQICLFSSRLLISLDISISCQEMGKEMGKIVSKQSTISGRINWKYFVVLRRRSLSQFSEKIQKLNVIF